MTVPRSLCTALCAAPWCLAILSFSWLIILRIPPLGGRFVVESQMDGTSPWIFPFLPSERATKPGMQSGGWKGQRITGDPVYAGARIPGPYERAEVTIEYRPERQPVLEFGLAHDRDSRELELLPLYASELQNTSIMRVASSTEWNARTTAVWFGTVTPPRLADASSSEATYALALRGAHDFYVVPAGGEINLMFTFHDSDMRKKKRDIVVRVFYENRELPDQTYQGMTSNHRVRILSASPGVYHIAWNAPDEIVLTSIQTTNARWVVGPRLSLGEGASSWVTTSRHLVTEARRHEGLQTITFGQQSLPLQRTHTIARSDRLDVNPSSLPVALRIPRGNLSVILDGYAALSRDAFFEPKPRRFTDAARLDLEGIRTVITSYRPPEDLGDGWVRSVLSFPISPQQDQLRFVLSAPGIASREGYIDLRKMRIAYLRPASNVRDWITTVKREAANAWRRRN